MVILWLLCLVGLSHAATVCDGTCQTAQRASLEKFYDDLGGSGWSSQQGWNQNAEFCTWQGVHCCDSSSLLPDSSIPCPVQGAVAGLDLAGNSLVGPWPAAALSGLADSLVHLNLRSNQLSGSLPSSISDLEALSRLIIDENRFAGPLPDEIGQLDNLTQFSAASNAFSGSLPAGLSSLQQLQWLLLDSNRLTGSVKADLLQLPQLEVLNLQDNQLSGALPALSGIGSSSMSLVAFGSNSFRGSIPASWLALPALVLDVSNNSLTGSVPAPASSNPVMRELRLGQNRLSGPVADSVRGLSPGLPGLRTVDLSGNELSSSGTGGVPDSLVLASSGAPRAIEGSGSDGPLLCQRLLLAADRSTEVVLDPNAYDYQGCSCKAPFRAESTVLGGMITNMRCVVNQGSNPPVSHVLGPLLAALLVSLAVLVCVAVAWRCGGFRSLGSKVPGGGSLRMLGGPEAGKRVPPGEAAKEVTLVLTDVQGSTELWEWDSQLASEAFKLHDRVLRQYMTQFYGYEVSTEGDAFLVAFHEPFDAVAWCLCVQLALHYAEWPEALLLHKSTCLDTAGTLDHKRRQRQERWQRHMQRELNSTRAGTGNPSTAGGPAARSAGPEGSLNANASTAAAAGGIPNVHASHLAAADVAGREDALPPAPLMSTEDHETGHNGNGGVYEDDTDSEGEFEDRMAEECARMHGASPSFVGRDVLFRGLRVRMSVATGGIDAVRLHSVTQRAEYVGEVLRKVQAVGETPQGGQVMLDADTFRGINARLPELGAVVLEATQKLLKNSLGITAAELAQLYNAPATLSSNTRAGGPEEGLRDSLLPRASIDFFSGLSIGEARNTNSNAKLANEYSCANRTAEDNTAEAALQTATQSSLDCVQSASRSGALASRTVDNGAVAADSDIESGMYRSEPRKPKSQRGLKQTVGGGLPRPLAAQAGTVAKASSSTNTTSTGESCQIELSSIPPDIIPPRRMSYNVRHFGSSNSLLGSPHSEGHAGSNGKHAPSPLASLWKWRSKRGGAVSPSAAAAAGADVAAGNNTDETDLATSSGSSREGNGSRGQQQGQQQEDSEKAASGLLASLRAGVWRNAVQGLGQKGRRSRGRTDADQSAHASRRRRSSLMYGVMVIDMGVHQLSGLVQKFNLTQVMPCGLEDRARFFSRLDSLRQETPGYFDAPAAGLVPLTHDKALLTGTAMPVITIVFCTIDKYFEMLSANQQAAELALELYSDCVRWLLLVGGGYECQEAEGTFMVAFSSADVAVEWCLMVQQVLRDMSWPDSVLNLPTCEEERDMHGAIMFRGPRVKMGVYSSVPTRVMPHTTTGRADYFGPMVNRAARYCHAAARGGQVLLPKELMCEIMSKWVMIDPVELMQSDRLLEFSAYFDEDRRLWPWMFKRRSRWEMALPPHLYLPLYQAAAMEEQMIAAAQQQQQHMPDALQQQQLEQQVAAAAAAYASGAGGDGLLQRGPASQAATEHQQQGQYGQGGDGLGPLPAGLRGQLLDSNLAPLQETAENASSRCTSELEPDHSHSQGDKQHQHGTDGAAAAGADGEEQNAVEGTFALRRPGLAMAQLQQLQQQLQQQQELHQHQHQQQQVASAYIDPSGWRVPDNPVHLQLQNALMLASGYRRPSYMSDTGSGHPRRSSGTSQPSTDASSQVYVGTPSSTPGIPTWTIGPLIYNWPGPQPVSQGTADYVIPPDRSRRQAIADGAVLDVQQQQQQVLVSGQQTAGRGPRWWTRGAPSPAAGTMPRSSSASTVQASPQHGVAPLQQVVVQGDGSVGGLPSLTSSTVDPSRMSQDVAARRRAEGVAQRSADWVAQRGSQTSIKGSAKASAGSSRAPLSVAATAGSSALSSAPNSNSSRASSGGVQPPAAMLMQGLESQVLPGMLHSSHRLRLVSKRRRQMSYCFFQESCQPGIPANGTDPRRMLPMHGGAYPQLGTLAGTPSAPGTNYAGSEAGGSHHPGAGTSGTLPVIAQSSLGAPSGQASSAAAMGPGSNTSAHAVGFGTASNQGLSNRGSLHSGSAGSCRTSLNPDACSSGPVGSADETAAAALTAPAAAGLGGATVAGGPQQQAAAAAVAAAAAAAAASDGDMSMDAGLYMPQQGYPGGAPVWGQLGPGMQFGVPSAAVISNNYCDLPEIKPLPDFDVMESLRLGAPRGHRASNLSSLTGTGGNESVAGFESADVGMMCADIMRGRWLWLRELLVHDVGQFRFKGVAGVHAIVSVTSGELGGRTFPTTIRRGKGQCIKLGRGLLALIQMRSRPRAQPWASFPPPGPAQGGPSTQPSGPLSGTGAGPSFSGITSDQPELLMQQLTDAAALSGSHAGPPDTPGGTASSNVITEGSWAAAAAAAAAGSLSSGSNVLGTPRGPLMGARASPYDFGLAALEPATLARYQVPSGWATPSYGRGQAAAAAAVAAWGMPMVRAASAGDLRMVPQAQPGGVGPRGGLADAQLHTGYSSGLPPVPPAPAGGAGGWRLPAMELPLAPNLSMGRPRANSMLMMMPVSGMSVARGRRTRSNSYTYGGPYADFASRLHPYPGAAAWGELSPYGSYVLSPASTDFAATGGGTWQLPPAPVNTPRLPNPLGWQQQQQLLQAHHAQQALLQGLQSGSRRPVAAGMAAVAGAQGAEALPRRRRHSVCMGDPQLQLTHRTRRLSGMRYYGPLVLEMQPCPEVEEWKYMSQELAEPSKQGAMRGGVEPSGRSPAAAGASTRTSGSGSMLLSPTSAALVPLTSPAGTAGSSFMHVGSSASIPEGAAAGPEAAAAAAGVGQEGSGLVAAAAATCSCPCNVVGMESASLHSALQQGVADGCAAAGTGNVVSAAEPVSPTAQEEAEAQGLAPESGVGTLS